MEPEILLLRIPPLQTGLSIGLDLGLGLRYILGLDLGKGKA